ncbi:MAG: hypothetical protein SOZ34_10400 [Clostridia bacterium]|nr:hypothetical protein [Clostridia bacterium]
MEGYFTYYCPITGKKVKVREETDNRKKTVYSTVRENDCCKNSNGICDGNCSGCRLL